MINSSIITNLTNIMKCKKCGSFDLIKNGKTKYHTQVYKCKNCGFRSTLTDNVGGRPKTNLTCRICGKKAYAKGLCENHYRQFKKNIP